ncbi:Uncharacterised protein [Mycobacteroides abscessus]|nr:Uncharacterised protein [Mycobacteroides abscessus]
MASASTAAGSRAGPLPLPALSVSIGELWLGVLVCQAVGAAAWGLRLAVSAAAAGVSAAAATAAPAGLILRQRACLRALLGRVNFRPGDIQGLGVQALSFGPNCLQQFLFRILVGAVGRHGIRLWDIASIGQAGAILEQRVLQFSRFRRNALVGL